jgi:hypothetical protein
MAETEVPCKIRQGITVMNADHGQPAHDLIAFRGGQRALFDRSLRSSRLGPNESHLRRRGAGMKEQTEEEDSDESRPQD